MQRRRFLRTAAAVGAGGALAGCSGGGDGDGGDGGGDGGDGDDGGGDVQSPTSGDTVGITTFPTNIPPLAWAENEGVFEEEMDAAGYDYSIEWTFEGPALFASGQTDIAFDISTIEAARMGDERDISTTIVAKMMTDNIGMILEAAGEYDPAETGSRQATVDKITDEDARIGIIGWSAGHAPVDQIIFQEVFGKAFEPDTGDFNVVEANPNALPELMKDDEVVMIANSPAHGSGEELMAGDFVELFYGSDEIAKQGFGMAPLINGVVKDEFMADHPEAVEAAVRAWDRATDWFYENGADEIPGNSEYMQQFGTEDPDVAEYITRWHQGEDVPSAYETDTPIYWQDPYIDDEWLGQNETFMDLAAGVGQAPEDWREYVTYERF